MRLTVPVPGTVGPCSGDRVLNFDTGPPTHEVLRRRLSVNAELRQDPATGLFGLEVETRIAGYYDKAFVHQFVEQLAWDILSDVQQLGGAPAAHEQGAVVFTVVEAVELSQQAAASARQRAIGGAGQHPLVMSDVPSRTLGPPRSVHLGHGAPPYALRAMRTRVASAQDHADENR